MKVKHFLRDGFVFFVSLTGLVFLYQMITRRRGPLVRIIAFHDVADREWFQSVVAMLVEHYAVITPEQFHAREFDSKKINILLTFDDGYQSWIDVCLPILHKYSLKGLFFINSGLHDIADNKQKVETFMRQRLFISLKEPLTWVGAKTLVLEGHTIGGHTVTHPNLALLNSDEADWEIREDKKRIEHMLNIILVDFAYPFGQSINFTPEVASIASKVGYAMQYSGIAGFWTPKQESSVPRALIEKNQSLSSIKLWIEGGYDIFKWITL